MKRSTFLFASFLALSMAQSVRAQVNPGLPPLNDFSNGKFDVVNISTQILSYPHPRKSGSDTVFGRIGLEYQYVP